MIDGGSGYTPSSTVTLKIGKPIGGIGTVFKADIIDRVGTLGIGSDVIIGINTESIKIGQTLKAIPNILDTSTTVIGIAATDGGNITLSKSASNTVEFVNGFEFGRYQEQSLAAATASVNSSGIVTLTSITTAGAGYTSSTLPTVIAPLPNVQKELISGIRFVEGFAGIITGIGTTSGTGGNPLALKFNVSFDANADFDKLLNEFLEKFRNPIWGLDSSLSYKNSIIKLLKQMAEIGQESSVSDIGVGIACARTAILGAYLNVKINCQDLSDKKYTKKILTESSTIKDQAIAMESMILKIVENKIEKKNRNE